MYSLSELESKINSLSVIHDLMFHRAKALNNVRAVLTKKKIPITLVTHALSHHLILNECLSIVAVSA